MPKKTTVEEIHMGRCVADIINSCKAYAVAYHKHFGNPVGDDYVIGDALSDTLKGVDALLNGPLGHAEGGDLSKRIYEIAHEHGLCDENGELR